MTRSAPAPFVPAAALWLYVMAWVGVALDCTPSPKHTLRAAQFAMPTCGVDANLSSPAADPYLSVVVATRTDHYGGSGDGFRLQQHVRNVARLARCFNLSPIEHIIVDWNPNTSIPAISSYLECADYTHVRLLTVSSEQHLHAINVSQCPEHQRRDMLLYHAKNVGIRRARGQFVLLTNGDDLLSTPLLEFLARRQLCPDLLYTAVRHDLPHALAVLPQVHCGPQWEAAANAVGCARCGGELPPKFKAHTGPAAGELHYVFSNFRVPKVVEAAKKAGIFSGSPGDFILAHHAAFRALQGMPERCARGAMDVWTVNALAGASKGHALFLSAALYHQWHRGAPYTAHFVVPATAFVAGLHGRSLQVQPYWGLAGLNVTEVPLTAPCSPCTGTPSEEPPVSNSTDPSPSPI
eukprot:EG_transcript_6950